MPSSQPEAPKEMRIVTYLQERLLSLHRAFADVPFEALQSAMIEGIEAFAWYKDGVQYVGSTGTTRRSAVEEIMACKQPEPTR
jgi:hypothetical protein